MSTRPSNTTTTDTKKRGTKRGNAPCFNLSRAFLLSRAHLSSPTTDTSPVPQKSNDYQVDTDGDVIMTDAPPVPERPNDYQDMTMTDAF
jgi:hypothetical protein